jgi:SH3-like domain-containing protein
MRRSARNSLKFGIPILALGLAGLMLIPAQPGRIGTATIVRGPAKLAATTRITSPITSLSTPTPVAARLQAELQTQNGGDPTGSAVKPAVELVSTPGNIAPDTTAASPAMQPADAEAVPAASDMNAADTSSLPSGRIGSIAVNARSGPAVSNDKLFVLSAGESVKVGETSGGWVHVYRQDGTDGWVYGRYLAGAPGGATPARAPAQATLAAAPRRPAAQPSRLPPPQTASMARLTDVVPLLQRPDDFRSTLGILQPGERVRVLNSDGRWLHVVTEDGASGWIPA